MYCSHFGLHRLPFNNTPDPTFYYRTPEHEEALATLQYATSERKGFVLVSGEVGAGKTLVSRMFLRHIEAEATTAVITNTHLTGRQLLAALCSEFGIDAPDDANSLTLTHKLQDYLLEQFAQDRYVIVLLDEAQNLPDESFEELRMLGNLEADDAKLLQVCILGQPELRDRFKQPNMRQLDQRLFCRFHLTPLSMPEVGSYIAHRLRIAGYQGDSLFTPDAIHEINVASQGVPRIVNQICDNALLTAYGQDRTLVDSNVVQQVLDRDPSLRVHAVKQDAVAEQPAIASEPQAIETATNTNSMNAMADNAAHAAAETAAVRTKAEELAETIIETRSEMTQVIADPPPALVAAANITTQHAFESQSAASTLTADGPTNKDIERLRKRQKEIQRVIKGSSDKWASTTDQFDRYRNELKDEINQISSRYDETRNHIDAMADQFASNESFKRMRTDYECKTQDLLNKIEEYRRDLETSIDQTREEWRSVEATISAAADQKMDINAVQVLRDNFNAQIEHSNGRIEQYRNQIVQLVQEVQAQCDETHTSLSSLKSQLTRRQDDIVQQFEEAMRQYGRDLEKIDAQMTERVDLTEQRLESLTATSATAETLQALREEHTTAVTDIGHQFKNEAQRLTEIKADLDTKLTEMPEIFENKIDELRTQLAQNVTQVRKLREKIMSSHMMVLERVTKLTKTYAKREDVEALKDTHEQQAEQNAIEHDGLIEQITTDRKNVETLKKTTEQQAEQNAIEHDGLIEQITTDRKNVETLKKTTEQQAEQNTIEHDGLIEQIAADRYDVELSLKQLQETKANEDDVLQRIEISRNELEETISQLDARCKAAEADIDTLHDAQVDDNEALAQFRRDQHETISDLQQRIEQQRSQLTTDIDGLVTAWKETQHNFEAFKSVSADAESVEALRRLQVADIHRVESLLDMQKRSTEQLGEQIDAHLSDLNNRLNQLPTQIESVREELQENQNQTRKAMNVELDALREAQHEQSVDILGKIENNRTEMQQLIDGVVSRCRESQEQISRIAVSQIGEQDEVNQFRARHERDMTQIMDQISHQRDRTNMEIEKVLASWQDTQAQLDTLSQSTADTKTVEAIRHQQSEDKQHVLEVLNQQRSETESLVKEINKQLKETNDRFEALPNDIATTDHIDAVREEHAANLSDLVSRIEEENAAHQDDVTQLTQKWEELSKHLGQVSASSVALATVKHLEHSIQLDITRINRRVNDVTGAQQNCLRTLVDKVQQLSGRINELESKPDPLHLELTPKMGAYLAQLIKTAEGEHKQLAEQLDRAEKINGQMDSVAANAQEMIDLWIKNAGEVNDQSEQLRASASIAAEIMAAMKSANTAVDAKLRSPKWKTELERGERLTNKLNQVVEDSRSALQQLNVAVEDVEQAMEEVKQVDQLTDTWAERRKESEQHSERLNAVMQRFARFTVQMTSNLAAQMTSSLAAARTEDEIRRPTPKPRNSDSASNQLADRPKACR